MSVSKKIGIGILIFTGIVVVGGLYLGERLSISGVHSFVSTAEFVPTAEAVVGRPLTPVSVAGVARRTARRTAARY
ncbi:MAG: hypothetical protein E2O67_04325 [Deltaproteobacteria bacterium]|nr:MAG: hypothetical protein E2O67_04325 [Deltaproteobacteria bacterium]